MRRIDVKMGILLVVMMLVSFTSPEAQAKKKSSHARAYSYFDDGGKHSQEECDPEKKAPRKLKTRKGFAKSSGYLGSEFIEAGNAEKGESEAWKHYFSSSSSCNGALKKQK